MIICHFKGFNLIVIIENNLDENNSDDYYSSSHISNSNNINTNFNQENIPILNIGNIPNEPRAAEPVTQISVNPGIMARSSCHIFVVNVEKKIMLGKRNEIYLNKAKHDKYEKKNILTRIKKAGYNNHLEYTNERIKDSPDEEINKSGIELKKVNNSKIEVSSKDDNLELIKLKMKDILSFPLSNNYKTIDKNYNKKAIDFILTRKDEKLSAILNKGFEDVIRIYAGELTDKDFDGFKTIEDELKGNSDLKEEDEEYIKAYKECAKNYKKNLLRYEEETSKKKKLINLTFINRKSLIN
mgnify:CR=1 FL=1